MHTHTGVHHNTQPTNPHTTHTDMKTDTQAHKPKHNHTDTTPDRPLHIHPTRVCKHATIHIITQGKSYAH